MKSLRKLQRTLLLKNYGFLGMLFLKVIDPIGPSIKTLGMWHPVLIKTKYFTDEYARSILYILLFFTLFYSATVYILTLFTLDEILSRVSAWFQQI